MGPGDVQMPPYYGTFGSIANTNALKLTEKTLRSCPGPQRNSCTGSRNTDYGGVDFAKVPGESIEACCHACSADSRCQGAVLYQGTCYLKTNVGKAETRFGRTAVFPARLTFV